ncbi:MAG: hypothetical protein QOF36_2600 [Microbacteriaceae bacterium]|jgi:hypothetical protein|nr:hypothetical protein [Microbacteriaceae bacterium]
MGMADAYIRGDDGEWSYLGKAIVNPCQVPDCGEPSTWTFEASGPAEAFEVLVGCLVEPGDKLRLCDPHAEALPRGGRVAAGRARQLLGVRMTAFGTAERTDKLLDESQDARRDFLACPKWRFIERARREREWLALVEKLRQNERERGKLRTPG